MAFGFGAQLGFLGFLALIPLLILYLIKPKTIQLAIPSLEFFSKRVRFKKTSSFLRYFVRDWLFLLQFLVLCFLAFSLTDPWFIREKDVVSSHLVFVLDASASSQARGSDEVSRFAFYLQEMKNLAEERNTLILVKSRPVLVVEDASRDEFLRLLEKLEVFDTESDLGSAILLAGDLLQESKGRVLVFSDFVHTKGMNPLTARNILESKGIPVDFIQSPLTSFSNLGFVHFISGKEFSHVYIKNYDTLTHSVPVFLGNEVYSLEIGPGDIEDLLIQTPQEASQLVLNVKDSLAVDNILYLSGLEGHSLRVLLLQDKEDPFLESALRSFEQIELEILEPPFVSLEGYDVVIVGAMDDKKLLPGWDADLLSYMHQGGSVILYLHSSSSSFDYGSLVNSIEEVESPGEVFLDQTTSFTKYVDLSSATHYFFLSDPSFLSLVSIDEKILFGLKQEGDGRLFYYGLVDAESDFPLSPSYPLFWVSLVKYLADYQDLKDLHVKTGTIFQGQEDFVLDRVGLYPYKDATLAVNLLHERESDLSFVLDEDLSSSDVVSRFALKPVIQEVYTDLRLPLLFFIVALLLFELAYLKWRGEL